MEERGSALPGSLLAAAAISISALWLGPSLLQAQRVRPQPPAAGSDAANENAGTGSFVAPDRNLLQVLKKTNIAMNEHCHGEALEGLAQVLRGSEDYFYQPDRKVGPGVVDEET